jgi:hypothetical protein
MAKHSTANVKMVRWEVCDVAGGTINAAARWRKKFCGTDSRPVHGFDTFTGEAVTHQHEHWSHTNNVSRTVCVVCKLVCGWVPVGSLQKFNCEVAC